MSGHLIRALCIGASALVSGPAFAQVQELGGNTNMNPEAAASDEGGEIVVTASKREQNLQDVPAAISVIGGATVGTAGVFDTTQLPKLVPGLVTGKQGTSAVVFLRGVGQTISSPATQPGISTNLDGIYLSRVAAGASFFDLERVEVLPGPQGTLYGRNAAGGVVNIVTRKPRNEYSADGFVEIGNYGLIHGFVGVDLPISENLSVRGAIDVNQRDGYLSNGGNDADTIAARVTAVFKPSQDFSAMVQYTHLREGGIGSQNIARGTSNPPFGSNADPYFSSFPSDNLFVKVRGDIVTGKVSLRISDGVTLDYQPSYIRTKSRQGYQFNGDRYGIFNPRTKQYSQELKLSGDGSRIKWLVGGFWFDSLEELDVAVGMPAVGFVQMNNKVKSYAAFGEATYSISDKFRVTGGARYSHDNFEGSGFQKVPPAGIDVVYLSSDTKGRADWKIGVEYDVADDSMFYATAQSGYLQGGFTQVDYRSSFPKTFEPTSLVAASAGLKNKFLDNSLQVNAEIFFYSYNNYQLQTTISNSTTTETSFVVVNAPKSEIYGGQLDISYNPSRNTRLDLAVSYLSAKITQGLNTAPSYDGFTLPNAPKWTINAGIEHRFPVKGGDIVARVATYFNSGYWTVFTHDDFSYQGAFTKTDLNLTYKESSGRWDFGFFARNIENSVVYYGSGAGNGPGTFLPTFVDAPRTYGLRAGFNF